LHLYIYINVYTHEQIRTTKYILKCSTAMTIRANRNGGRLWSLSLSFSLSLFLCIVFLFSDSALPFPVLHTSTAVIFVAVCWKSQYFIYFIEEKGLFDCRNSIRIIPYLSFSSVPRVRSLRHTQLSHTIMYTYTNPHVYRVPLQ